MTKHRDCGWRLGSPPQSGMLNCSQLMTRMRQNAPMSEKRIQLTIAVTEAELNWAVAHINNWIADQPVNTEPLAHRFVSALTNPVATS